MRRDHTSRNGTIINVVDIEGENEGVDEVKLGMIN